jgi:peroxiredoxin Q/BCP
MNKIDIESQVPQFTLKNQKGKDFNISKVIGEKNLVIYFYPKDDTPGCTREACGFRDSFEIFAENDAEVIGISSDSIDKHKSFAEKYNLPFTLLSDPKNKIRKLFGVPKSMLGLLPGRVTYIIDKKGTVRHIFNSQLQIEKHINEALQVLKSLN